LKPVLNITLAVLAGIVIGSIVNMGIITFGPLVIPYPEGADTTTMDKLAESMKLFTPVNFVVPFVAHALGALVGAFVAVKLATSHRLRVGIGVSVFFLLGGISAVVMLGGPAWFMAADLLLAYLPMGYAGAWLAGATSDESSR
jgi:hypothetical protein